MGNDKQIKDSLERSKAVFLPEIIENPEGKPVLYNLESEYAKTRKNTPFLLYLFVAGFVVLIIVVSMVIISVKQRLNRPAEIGITEFEDVKLKELIDSSRKNEDKVDQIRREVSLLEEEYNEKIEKINQEFDRLREDIMAQEMNETDKNSKMTSLSNDKNKKLKTAENEYVAKRREKEGEISTMEMKLKSIGSSMTDSAKKYKDILGGEGKLHKMEIQNLKNTYEKKLRDQREADRRERESLVLLYNPMFKEKNLTDILQKTVPDVKEKNQYFAGIDDELAVEKAATKEQIAKMVEDIKKKNALNERLKQIPYKNSVQRSLLHSDSLAKQIFNGYDTILQKMAGTVQGKNLNIKYYNYAFDYMTKSQQESGYILDPRDKTRVGIFINRVNKPRNGDMAFIFRTDDEYIATIKLKQYQGVLVGEVVDLAPRKEIRPFDKLMLKMESEKK
jgi:G3E family GTPase